MKKIQAIVKYEVIVNFEVPDNWTDEQVEEKAEVVANDEWSSNAEIDDIDWWES